MDVGRPEEAREWPVVLGVDPGTRLVGYGLVVVAPDRPRLLAAGVLRAGTREPIAQRLDRVRAGVEEVLERFRPTCAAIETAFAGLNARAALRIGEGRGVVLACAARFGLSVTEYPPATVKKALVGNGAASKHQVAGMVRASLAQEGLELGLDATDALAIALTHVFRTLRAPRTIASPARAPRARGTAVTAALRRAAAGAEPETAPPGAQAAAAPNTHRAPRTHGHR